MGIALSEEALRLVDGRNVEGPIPAGLVEISGLASQAAAERLVQQLRGS